MKTKFNGNYCAFVTLIVLDDLKWPGVTQNQELINLVKPLHIKAKTGSQMSVVTIYAHTIIHIWRKTILEYFFKDFLTMSQGDAVLWTDNWNSAWSKWKVVLTHFYWLKGKRKQKIVKIGLLFIFKIPASPRDITNI